MKRYIFLMMFISSSVYSEEFRQYNVEINRLGTHNGQVFYLNLKESFKTDCAWGGLYCPITDENCNNYYAMLLSAKMAKKKLAEIRYIQNDSSKKCDVKLVAIG